MTLDILIFSIFLIVNLIIGLWYGQKVTTLRQYAIGDKKFATRTIATTIAATNIGGGFLFYSLETTYSQGLLLILPTLLINACELLFARFVVVRMGAFLHYLSVSEAMYNLYGKAVGFMTAVSSTLYTVGRLAVQFKTIPKILFIVFDIESVWITLITGGIVIVYAVWGGMRSVTLTDVVQLIAICIGLPILLIIVYHGCHHPSPVKMVFTTYPQFSWKPFQEFMGWNTKCMNYLSMLFLLILPSYPLSPTSFQRIAMTHSVHQAKQAFTYATFLSLFIILSIVLLGILLVAHNATLNPKELVQYMATTYTSCPAFKGLLAIVVVALAMSTADSFLHAASVLLHDLVKLLHPTEEKKNKLVRARIYSSGIGVLALLLTFSFDNLHELVLLTHSFFIPIYIPSFFLAICGFQSTPTVVLSSMIAGSITVILWLLFLTNTGIDSTLPGIVANCLTFFISHALLPKPKNKAVGWVRVQSPKPEESQKQV